MGYLDELKKQQEVIRSEQKRQQDLQGEESALARQLQPGLQTIHKYLREAIEVLNVVQPEVPVEYAVKGLGSLNNLRQENYTISVDDWQNIQELAVRFECLQPDADVRVLNIKGRNDFVAQREYLWRNNFQFKEKFTMDGGTLYVEPKVIVRLEFSPDVKQRKIRLHIRNLLEVGSTTRWIEPKDITRDKLDELMGLILRKTRDLGSLSTGQMTEDMRARIKEGVRREQEVRRRHEVQLAAELAAEEQARTEDKLVSRLRRNIGTLVKRK